jgi:uncharacterized protein YndB with AHSA1/START domain
MGNKNSVVIEAQMLIRKSAETVFQAFVDPAITTNFWFTRSSGKLALAKTVIWEWEMYGASTNVLVKEFILNRKISIEWGSPITKVDFELEALTVDTTYVTIKNYGFDLNGDELVQAIKGNTGGFTTVLDGLKAYLEHGINLNLIADKFPGKVKSDWKK